MKAKVAERGQVTIPKALRKKLGLAPGTILDSEVVQEAALEAARHWHAYRSRGGSRQRIAADFIVGAHALVQCDRLLTRDRGFYRGGFDDLTVLDPSDETEDDAGA